MLRYAKKSGMRTASVSFSDLTVREPDAPEQPFFTSEHLNKIIAAAKEPYKTMFALSCIMGTRAGELLALTVDDLDFRQKTILRRLGINDKNAGLHAFRHGLATAENEPITVLQTQMRHADVRTTLRVYAHVIPQSQRDSMERIAKRSIGTFVPIGTRTETQHAEMIEDW